MGVRNSVEHKAHLSVPDDQNQRSSWLCGNSIHAATVQSGLSALQRREEPGLILVTADSCDRSQGHKCIA